MSCSASVQEGADSTPAEPSDIGTPGAAASYEAQVQSKYTSSGTASPTFTIFGSGSQLPAASP
jgi:hypothetical protein